LKTLVLDIETAPKVAYVWRYFKENISPKQVKEHGHMMSFAAKWLGVPEIIYEECRKDDDTKLVSMVIQLIDEADIVVVQNGARFDLPEIRGRAVVNGLNPPSPVKIIDTFKVAKKEFNFSSNSLEYLAEVLDCKIKKGKHKKFPGFELWLECLRKNEEAWSELKEYNIDDVLVLEEIYLKMRPWITDHPNMHVNEHMDRPCCPKCGSENVQLRGYAYTASGKFHKFICNDCGGWARSRYTLLSKNENILGNLVQ
jgi:hypothetical protein